MIKDGELWAGTRDADATAGNVLTAKTAYAKGSKVTGTMPNKAGDNACSSSSVSSTTLKLVAPEGYYDGSDDTVTVTDADFVAANIKTGVNVLGITGTLVSAAEVLYTKVTITADTDISDTYAAFTWTSEVHDDLGAWVVGAPTRLTVPAGVTVARFVGYAGFSNNNVGTRKLKIVKNGATTIFEVVNDAQNESGTSVDSGFISVTKDDYFELYISTGSSSCDVMGSSWAGPAWFQMETRNNVPVKRTVVGKHALQTMSSWTTLTWDFITEDQLGCWSSGAPTRLTVPAGYTVGRITADVCMPGNSGLYGNITKNGTGNPLVVSINEASAYRVSLHLDTGWVAVAENDYFTVVAIQGSSYTLYGQNYNISPSRFCIELLP